MSGPTCGDKGGVTSAGTPCRGSGRLVGPNGLCMYHDPVQADEVKRRQALGRTRRGTSERTKHLAVKNGVPPAPQNLADAVVWASWAMHAVASGQLDARVGHEVGYLVNAFKAAVEKADLLTEIAQLRKDLADARKDAPKLAVVRHG